MRPKSTTLTAHELELMKIVWQHEAGVTVRDVYEELRTQRAVAYTTVMTSLKTLEQKGHLNATQQDRAHVYRTPRARPVAPAPPPPQRRGARGAGPGDRGRGPSPAACVPD